MKVFNWHIIHDRELKQIREIDLKLKRKFSPSERQAILDGRAHCHLNPKKKAAA